AAAKVAAQSGADAVAFSVQQNSMQANMRAVASEDKDEKEKVVLRNTVNNQFVANKNFINQNGVWVDSEFTDRLAVKEMVLKFASDEYFKLIEREPGLAPYLSLGEQVVVVWKGSLYRITK
ncbi:MAG TPA: hypothetical protein VHQ01_03975, partial [Pyrinomonadaceae bacterium]|nr:hypothetical protein [Pyrinomonadaceae bacterium]